MVGYDMPKRWFIFASLLIMFVASSLVTIIIYSTVKSYQIMKSKTNQSHRVHFLLRMFTDALLVETIFAFCIYIPIGLAMINLMLFPRYFNFILPSIFTITQLYGIVESFCVIFFVEPYRRASRHLLCFLKVSKPVTNRKILTFSGRIS